MSPERWKKLEEICHAAWLVKPSERRAFLDQACAGDEELWREAESLLAADGAAADDFLQSGALTLGMQALADQETRRDEMNAATTEVFEIEISVGMILDGRYEILAALDAGGMGEVYKARDRRLNRLVVVKVLKKKSRKNPWTVRKFRDEGEAQGRIQHPNVATVLDTGALPSGEQYLVMEFIDGRTLRQIIKDRQVALREAAEIIKQAGRAVAAIHSARLIHRDLKPENIMVHHEAETGEFVVKVIDFGIVRDLDKSTVVGQIIGTPLYMSPEQLDGKEATTAADVYALGEIAYEMLTGNHPFNPEDMAHLLKLKQEEVKVKPSALRPGLPQAAEDLILTALSPKANKRQSSARAFGDDLARELTTEIIEPPPPPPSPPINRWLVMVFIAILSLGLWLWFGKPDVPPPHERTLTYWLTIVRQRDGKTIRATGRETFDTGDEFQFNTTPGQTGALYLFNEGTSQSWHVLFPTPANNQENARLAALQTINTQGYIFTNQSGTEKGTEKIWVVWATQPIPLLDEIARQSVKTKLTVSDPSQEANLRQFMSEHRAPPEISLDKDQSQVTLKGRGEILVYLLELEHKDWK